ncbi:sensor domain-containing protein [Streptosporangium sp. NPDC001559]|uniref:sensor domain-containing protein n=1 Tax=Streptosporangium sp. NPDC001559 TaxID=3366187 RepID=UPI0036E63B5A
MNVLTATRNAALFLIAGLGTALLALPLAWLVVYTALLSLSGVGLPLITPVTRLVRRLSGWQRRRLGIPAPPYLPLEGPLPARVRAAVGDPVAPREVLWLLAHGVTGIVLGLLALGLPLTALNAATLPLWWSLPPGDPPSVLWYPIDSWPLALTGPVVAAGYVGVACLVLPSAAGLSERLSRRLLKPVGRVRLAQQVAMLTAARSSGASSAPSTTAPRTGWSRSSCTWACSNGLWPTPRRAPGG